VAAHALIATKAFDEVLTLVTLARLLGARGAGVGLVHDDKLWAAADKFFASTFRLDEVERHDYVRVDIEEGLAQLTSALKSGRGAWENEFSLYVKLRRQFAMPLFR
jgi:hypothetical protein